MRAAVLIGCFSMMLVAQAPAPRFDAASIKPHAAGARGYSLQVLPGGKLRALNVTLRQLLAEAYHLHDFQVVGPADALTREHYDVSAESGETTSKTDVQLRLQTLLSERFGVVAHTSHQPGNELVLSVDKGGARLTPTLSPNCVPRRTTIPCGFLDVRNRSEVYGDDVALSDLLDLLAELENIQVEDRTGLTGRYDIHLKWQPEAHGLTAAEGMNAPAAAAASQNDAGLYTAIREQLGLRLDRRTGAIPVLIVDRVGALKNN
ncbi:MAG TPA: TIGR03435 family protein [Terriglobales bacterium]|nr:TIGR03435 family protein [Terriglobales bacterium]